MIIPAHALRARKPRVEAPSCLKTRFRVNGAPKIPASRKRPLFDLPRLCDAIAQASFFVYPRNCWQPMRTAAPYESSSNGPPICESSAGRGLLQFRGCKKSRFGWNGGVDETGQDCKITDGSLGGHKTFSKRRNSTGRWRSVVLRERAVAAQDKKSRIAVISL